MTHTTVLSLALAIATVFALVIALAAGILAQLTGATTPGALQRSGVAFAGAFTLALAVIGLVATTIND